MDLNPKRDEAPNWCFENIATLSHSARTIHVVYVGFLVYCALTLFGTPDRKVILNEAARLPLLNLDVPFKVFVIAAPIVAIFMFVYFQLHVQVLKRAILDLRNDYAKHAKGRLYPWMIHLAVEPEIGAMGNLQTIIVHISLWWLLPIVLLLFTSFSLRQHNDRLSYFELLMSSAGVLLVFWLYNRYHEIPTEPQNSKSKVRSGRPTWMEAHPVQVLMGVFVCGAALFLLLMISDSNKTNTTLFDVDLSEQVLIREEKDRLGRYWAAFQGFQLQRADLTSTVLTRANLRNVQLQQAKLDSANLEFADLYAANLQEATLSNAILKHAEIRVSNLARANLNCANLSDSNLEGTDLTDAFLMRANLSGAKNLNAAQLSKVKTLYGTSLDKHLEAEIKEIAGWLFNEPLLVNDVISAKGEFDAKAIGGPKGWQTEPPEPDVEVGGLRRSRKIPKSIRDLKSGDSVYSASVYQNYAHRIFEADFNQIVRQNSGDNSVAEVRFFVTRETKEEKYYVQSELVSKHWMKAPCTAPPLLVDSKIYEMYAGQYELSPASKVTIRKDGERLMAQKGAQASNEVFPVSETEFLFQETGGRIIFIKDEEGEVSGVIIVNQDGQCETGRKVK